MVQSTKHKQSKEKSTSTSYKKYIYALLIILAVFLIWNSFIRTQTTGPDDNAYIRNFTRSNTSFETEDPYTDHPIDDLNWSYLNNTPVNKINPPNIQLPPSTSPPNFKPKTIPPAEKPADPKLTGEDTDGGKNFLVKGTCKDYIDNYSSEDVCLTASLLSELEYLNFYTDSNKLVQGCFWTELKDCGDYGDFVCEDGACVAAKITATSQDETYMSVLDGFNQFVKGTCSDRFGVHQETCLHPQLLNEFYVDGEDCVEIQYYCEHGCEDGACLAEPKVEEDPYIVDGIMDCNSYCVDNNYYSGNLPSEGLCEVQKTYKEFTCCCNQKLSEPIEDCNLYCKNLGFDTYNRFASSESLCNDLQGVQYTITDWQEDTCCCYFNAYDEDGETNDYTTKSSCYYDIGLFLEDACVDSQFLNEQSLVLNPGTSPTCEPITIDCKAEFGETYRCSSGACVPDPKYESCDSYCKSIVGTTSFGSIYSSGACQIGRGTPQTVCSTYSGTYVAEGDITCDTGYCCCS